MSLGFDWKGAVIGHHPQAKSSNGSECSSDVVAATCLLAELGRDKACPFGKLGRLSARLRRPGSPDSPNTRKISGEGMWAVPFIAAALPSAPGGLAAWAGFDKLHRLFALPVTRRPSELILRPAQLRAPLRVTADATEH